MSRRVPIRRWACALTLSAIVLSGSHSDAQTTTLVRGKSAVVGLPDSTTLLVRVNALSGLYERFKTSPFYALKEHPQLAPLFAQVEQEVTNGIQEVQTRLGFDPRDLLAAFQGEVLIAVGGLDKLVAGVMTELSGGTGAVTPNDFPLIIAGDAGANHEDVSAKLEKVFGLIKEEGGQRADEDFRGGKITTFTNTQRQAGDEIENVFFGKQGSSFFFSVNRPFLESTMAGMGGAATSSLALDADYVASNALVGANSDLQIFFNVRSARNAIQKAIQANPFYGMFWGLIETKLIGTSLKNFASGVSLTEKSIVSKNFFNTGGKRDGLLALTDGPAFSAAEVAKTVPADVQSLNVSTVNFGNLYQLLREVANMAMSVLGNPGVDVEQLLELQFQIKAREIVDALGSQIFYYSKDSAAQGQGFTSLWTQLLGDTVVGIPLKQEAPIKNFLGQLPALLAQNMVLSEDSVKKESFMGTELMKFDEGGPTLALVGKGLVVGATPEAVKRHVRQQQDEAQPSLADRPDFKLQTAALPAKVSALSFMKDGAIRDSLSSLTDTLDADGNVPSLDPVLGIFGAGSGFAQWTDKGYFSSSTMALKPLPPAEKGTKKKE